MQSTHFVPVRYLLTLGELSALDFLKGFSILQESPHHGVSLREESLPWWTTSTERRGEQRVRERKGASERADTEPSRSCTARGQAMEESMDRGPLIKRLQHHHLHSRVSCTQGARADTRRACRGCMPVQNSFLKRQLPSRPQASFLLSFLLQTLGYLHSLMSLFQTWLHSVTISIECL